MDVLKNVPDDDLKMDLMNFDDLKSQVQNGEIEVKDIMSVPSKNKQVAYNLTFTEHLIQLRINGKTNLYLLDSLLLLRDICTDKIMNLISVPIVNIFIRQVIKEWDNGIVDSKYIFFKNEVELAKVDNENACPTLNELKEYEKNMHSSELEDIINNVEHLRKEKEELEHNALNARVEMNYLNCKFHPMGLKIARIEDAEEKKQKLVEICQKCTEFQERIKKCIRNYEILIQHDMYMYEDVIMDLSTRDNFKYNEYIRELIKLGKIDSSIKDTMNEQLEQIEYINVIFSNILYLSNFIKKERLYTLNILKMYLEDINANYLSENCGISTLKKELEESIEPPKETEKIQTVIEEEKPKLSYNDNIKNSITDKLKQRLDERNKVREEQKKELEKDMNKENALRPVPTKDTVPLNEELRVAEQINEAAQMDEKAAQVDKQIINDLNDDSEKTKDSINIEELKKLKAQVEQMLQGLNK
tara:strand:- start:48 stop:1466 length:1419 start_codon:yes stop_codon:yes gene_type:complete